jgi:tellurite methyltransferase
MGTREPSSEADWEKRYREGFYDGAVEPHELVKRFWEEIPKGPVIDLAMGNGRDAVFLAERGFWACGLERSREAARIAKQKASERGCELRIIIGDAGALPFRTQSAQGVMVFCFLLRHTMGDIAALLKKDGILMYETFLKRQNQIDRRRNPDHLLDDGELIGFFGDMEPLFYEETISFSGGKRRALARFVGRKR